MSWGQVKVSDAEKPKKLQEKHLKYLDTLRETGVTNMFGAVPWLRNAFPRLKQDEAISILSYWMKTFSDRHGIVK